jgi:hypothetical protein
MIVQAKLGALKGIAPREWALRFLFGGVVCVLAGLISKRFGPEIGGLFLAFPAIFPAGASLVEAHEKKHKARAGIDGANRGRTVAGIDAAGTTLGCVGLAGFALTCWICLPQFPTPVVLALASFVWCVLSLSFWLLRKSRVFRDMRTGKDRLHAFRSS